MPNALAAAMVRRDGPTGPALNQPGATPNMANVLAYQHPGSNPMAPGAGTGSGVISHAAPAAAGNPYMSAMPAALAQARANIAAQYALAAGSVDAAQRAGANMAGQLPGQYGAANAVEGTTLRNLAAGTTQAATRGGLGLTRGISSTTNDIGASGDMATGFAQGAVPLIQQGISARGTAQRNALQIQRGQSESELAMKEAEYQQAQQDRERQRQYDIQDQLTQRKFERERSEEDFRRTLTLKQLESDANGSLGGSVNPLQMQSWKSQQDLLNKGNVTSFTADQIPAIRESPQYQLIVSLDPEQRQRAAEQFLRTPGHRAVIDLARLDGLVS